MTEPEVSGADSTGLRTRAVQDGDEWVINGHKWFTSGANRAAFATVMAVTEPDASPNRTLQLIVVPTDAPGFEIVRVVPVMGETTGGHCEVRYNDVRVPLTNLLGPRGQAFKIAQKRLGPGRIYKFDHNLDCAPSRCTEHPGYNRLPEIVRNRTQDSAIYN